jgi:transcriptional regulator of arginine metabolism
MSTSSARRRIIRSLLSDHEITSQGDSVDLLAERGFEVTQATVSRDLSVIGAHKNGHHYVLGGGPSQSSAELALAGVIDAFVLSIEASANLVVLKTPPGAAQVVAAALDRVSYSAMAGCVAGDDTVIVVVGERSTGRDFAAKLQELGASV